MKSFKLRKSMVTVKYSAEIDEISMINSSIEPIERTFDCFSVKKVRPALSKKLKGKIIPCLVGPGWPYTVF